MKPEKKRLDTGLAGNKMRSRTYWPTIFRRENGIRTSGGGRYVDMM
jgi:hypothetical protein